MPCPDARAEEPVLKRAALGRKIGKAALFALLVFFLSFLIRLLEWPAWQNPEYKLGDEMLLATHDAYHWVAGAIGFGLGAEHPMASILKIINLITGFNVANIAFWLPPVMASLTASAVCLWCILLGSTWCGMAAGLTVSIAPGFLGRTLLGYYDTDLVTLLFPLVMAFIPALWAKCTIMGKASQVKSPEKCGALSNPLANLWICLLALAGLLTWSMETWHSVFPYLARCDCAFLGLLPFIAKGVRRKKALLGAVTYILPAMLGPYGFCLAAAFFIWPLGNWTREKLLWPWPLFFVWGSILPLLLKGNILDMALMQINAYLKTAPAVSVRQATDLVFPYVAHSIIEIQNLAFTALFPYFHPWFEASVLGVFAFIAVVARKPCAVFLLPLVALAFSGSYLGGRMVMFGAPVAAIGLTFSVYFFMRLIFRKTFLKNLVPAASCAVCILFLVVPYLYLVSSLSQGPVLNRRHAAALVKAGEITPQDAMLWVWWDWGYAAQYFARRATICDGAQHSGPSLYLPAAVFAADNPRFARQIIRRTSGKGNIPANFFKGLDAQQAQHLINTLRSRQTSLEKGKGEQYLVTSFELLKLGFWISNYGTWNFITRTGAGGALSIIPQALSYNLNLGEVRLEDSGRIILPTSINVFEETGLVRRNYLQEWVDKNPRATALQKQAWLAGRRNVNFLLNRVTDEKLAMDEKLYSSLMTQLLLCDPGDSRFSPYFKLVYDNVFVRIYQVLPREGEN